MKARKETTRWKPRMRDWFLLVGLCLGPMTGLRIWKIGPAEVLCLLWGLKFLITRKLANSDILRFFVLFYLSLVLGSIAGTYIAPNELSISGLYTWFYLGCVSISFYQGLKRNSLEYNENLFFVFAIISTIWYLFLFIYSEAVSRTFLGAPLWYGSNRFSGGATNPHQIAILLCALGCIFLHRIHEKKLICTIGYVVVVFLILQTKSSTALLAIAVSTLVYVYYYLAHLFKGNRKRAMLVLFLLVLIFVTLTGGVLFKFFMNWIASDANGLGRLSIFSSFFKAFEKSPFVGLGPGVHGKDGLVEFHNTYLEVLAAGGILGGISLLVFSIHIFKKSIQADWKLFVIIVSIYTYSLAGFAMRRLVYWGILMFVVVIAEQKFLVEQKKNGG